MGFPSSQIQSPQTGRLMGKGNFQSSDSRPPQANQPQTVGGNVTYPGQGGQPQMGSPNTYSNTVGPWDNASIQNSYQNTIQPWSRPTNTRTQSGKGKGY